jgi:PAS domain S-box-containing protein
MPTKGGNVVSFVAQPVASVGEAPVEDYRAPLKILVIDDSPEDRKMVRLALETGNFVLHEAENGRSGVAKARIVEPDCILLDYRLSDLDGLQVLNELRAPDGDIPFAIVMLTDASEDLAVAKLLKNGALDYLDKHQLNDSLRHAIRDSLENFRLMAAQRKLQSRNAQLAAIVTSSCDAIVSVGLDLTVLTWNPGAAALFGYSEDEAKGRTLDELIVPSEYRESLPEHYRAIVSERKAIVVEALRRRKDGGLIPVEINAAPIQDEDDRTVAISVVFRDIGQSKRGEEKFALLMHEVEHRSKNVLATVQAIAKLTKAGSRDEFVELFVERLMALAANHSLLIANQWRGARIAEVVRAQLAHFGERDAGQLTIEGRDCILSSNSAQALGMTLHELATNAAKYGALSNDAGRVSLSWRLAGEGADQSFAMSWMETGGPPVVPPARSGFGSLVIGRMIEAATRGKVKLEYAPTGFIWRIECPADSILASATPV